MISKGRDPYQGKDKFEKAGIKAEEKMAWYLKRAFGKSKDIYIFNDLRLKFDKNDYMQIDHLIMHPHGFVFIESKSVSSAVKIDKDGYWERLWNNKWEAMPSPLKQVGVQADSFRQILEAKTNSLREKSLFGLIQRSFDVCPFDVVVAISDNGKISGNKAKEVMKAEAVCEYIKNKINIYKAKWAKSAKDLPVHFRDNEPKTIKQFLLKSHCPKHQAEKIFIKTPVDMKNENTKCTISIKEPPPQYSHKTSITKKNENNEKKPPHICNKCNEPFEIRFGYSFHLYCPNCKNRRISIQPACLQCQHQAKLERQVGTRIVEYVCTQNTNHIGIYHKNRDIYLEDKK